VVALAILVLLLNILGGISIFNTQNPSEEAVNLIKSQINSPAELRTSGNPVTFRKDDSLNVKAIASRSGVLTQNQVCVSKGEHEDTSEFEWPGDEGKILKFNGSQLRVRLSVICDTGTELQDDLESNGLDGSWLDNDACQSLTELNQTACVIALRFA
jgi:hypothetical protein